MLSNRYIMRKVADHDARACFICYKPTTSVMVNETPEADFFYICAAHLNDPGFASPDASTQAALKERELKETEITKLKQEWEAVQAKKTKAGKGQEGEDKEKPSEPPKLEAASLPTIRKVYESNRSVFNSRVATKRRIAQEKKTQSILQTPGLFPKTPTHKPQ